MKMIPIGAYSRRGHRILHAVVGHRGWPVRPVSLSSVLRQRERHSKDQHGDISWSRRGHGLRQTPRQGDASRYNTHLYRPNGRTAAEVGGRAGRAGGRAGERADGRASGRTRRQTNGLRRMCDSVFLCCSVAGWDTVWRTAVPISVCTGKGKGKERDSGRAGQSKHHYPTQGPVSWSPCALLKLDFLTNECICCIYNNYIMYALVRKYSFSKAQVVIKPVPGPIRLLSMIPLNFSNCNFKL